MASQAPQVSRLAMPDVEPFRMSKPPLLSISFDDPGASSDISAPHENDHTLVESTEKEIDPPKALQPSAHDQILQSLQSVYDHIVDNRADRVKVDQEMRTEIALLQSKSTELEHSLGKRAEQVQSLARELTETKAKLKQADERILDLEKLNEIRLKALEESTGELATARDLSAKFLPIVTKAARERLDLSEIMSKFHGAIQTDLHNSHSEILEAIQSLGKERINPRGVIDVPDTAKQPSKKRTRQN
jgi:chromosome segregation ATPase